MPNKQMPPGPPRGPHGKHEVKREKIGTTVDPVLFELFSKERDERRVSTATLLDTILWHYFDKPTLSYQEPEEAQSHGN